ncbi:hypothetical protein TL16_g07276 [Triparma laevis f. inornata]|uniref:Tyrosine-protein kinase ephrin type A/B receptor-like domain-containing protein n=1 Tax=Triparma laevis f. inornata TaxID=1714386 RepID=A0A9W7ED90_9STRA|nr:hypothetical protein TL16_g07276 [Triparma laevis f. inornata]
MTPRITRPAVRPSLLMLLLLFLLLLVTLTNSIPVYSSSVEEITHSNVYMENKSPGATGDLLFSFTIPIEFPASASIVFQFPSTFSEISSHSQNPSIVSGLSGSLNSQADMETNTLTMERVNGHAEEVFAVGVDRKVTITLHGVTNCIDTGGTGDWARLEVVSDGGVVLAAVKDVKVLPMSIDLNDAEDGSRKLCGDIESDVVVRGERNFLECITRVMSNVTMTIEKGSTVIADHYDDAADTVALVVMPGGKIFVEGTEEEPITFLSAKADADSQYETTHGLWGGIIIRGLGDSSFSGSISYLRIRNAGKHTEASSTVAPSVSPTKAPTMSPTTGPTTSPTLAPSVSPTTQPTVATASPTSFPTMTPTPRPTWAVLSGGRRLSSSSRSLTLDSSGGLALGFVNVGNLTSVSHVEVAFSSNSNTDTSAVIFRGGNVNAKYLSLLYCGEQGVSMRLDNGYQGNMQFLYVITSASDAPQAEILATHDHYDHYSASNDCLVTEGATRCIPDTDAGEVEEDLRGEVCANDDTPEEKTCQFATEGEPLVCIQTRCYIFEPRPTAPTIYNAHVVAQTVALDTGASGQYVNLLVENIPAETAGILICDTPTIVQEGGVAYDKTENLFWSSHNKINNVEAPTTFSPTPAPAGGRRRKLSETDGSETLAIMSDSCSQGPAPGDRVFTTSTSEAQIVKQDPDLTPALLTSSSLHFMDPRPNPDSTALFEGTNPPEDSFFTNGSSFIGAFSSSNWLKKWTWFEENGNLAVDLNDEVVCGEINEDTTWGGIIRITCDIVVRAATLTIDPGTIIRAHPNTNLFILSTASLVAVGDVDSIIRFTTAASDDSFAKKPNRESRAFWGGLTVSSDSSQLSYVRLEYASTGLTLSNVGVGSTVSNVEAVFGENGFELDGGTVELEHVSALYNGQLGYYMHSGYRGKLHFSYSALSQDSIHAVRVVGSETFPKVFNSTFIGRPETTRGVFSFEDGSGGEYRNLVVTNLGDTGLGVSRSNCSSVFSPTTLVQNATEYSLVSDPYSHLLWSKKNVVFGSKRFQAKSCDSDPAPADFLSRNLDPLLFDSIMDPRPRHNSIAYYTYDKSEMRTGNTKGDDFTDEDEFLGAFTGVDNWMRGFSWLDRNDELKYDIPVCANGMGSFGDIKSSSECFVCPLHTYDNPHNNKCENCVFGTYAFQQGSTSCEQSVNFENYCNNEAEGYYWTESSESPFNQEQGRNCLLCGVGNYVNENDLCEPCPDGTESGGGLNRCEACLDQYHPSPDRGLCEKCAPGQYWSGGFDDVYVITTPDFRRHINCSLSTDTGSFAPPTVSCKEGGESSGELTSVGKKDGACVTCPAGKFNVEGKGGECFDCTEVGTYSFEGATHCTTVQAGYYVDEDDRTDKIPCPKDHFCEGGMDHFTPCDKEKGLLAPQGSAVCEFYCQPGTYLDAAIANDTSRADHQCHDCPVGKFLQYGENECEPCANGHEAPSPGTTVCLICTAGRFLSFGHHNVKRTENEDGEQIVSCQICEVGKFSDKGAEKCTLCEAGKYTNATGQPECTACGPHQKTPIGGVKCECKDTFTRDPSTGACVCPIGQENYGGVCRKCLLGYFKAKTGTEMCTSCLTHKIGGSYTEQEGSISENDCDCSFNYDQAGTLDDGFTIDPDDIHQKINYTSNQCECDDGYRDALSERNTSMALGLADWVKLPYISNHLTPLDCEVDSLIKCKMGEYKDKTGFCKTCVPGKYGLAIGAIAIPNPNRTLTDGQPVCGCKTWEADVAGDDPVCSVYQKCCDNCQRGKYSNEGKDGFGSVKCLTCSIGEYASEGSDICTHCNKGYFNARDVKSRFYDDNVYKMKQNFDINLAFIERENGDINYPYNLTEGPREPICIRCLGGVKEDLCDMETCLTCTESGPNEVINLTIKEGWWRSHDWSFKFEKCKIPGACINGTCAKGYTGPMCSRCADNWVDPWTITKENPGGIGNGVQYSPSPTGECEPCVAGEPTMLFGHEVSLNKLAMIIFGIFLLFALLFWKIAMPLVVKPLIKRILSVTKAETLSDLLMRFTRVKARSDENTKFVTTSNIKNKVKICGSFYQIISQFSVTLSVPFPAIFNDLMSSLGKLFNVEIFSILKMGCVMGNSYTRTLAFTMTMPIAISVTIAISSLIYAKNSERTAEVYKEPYEELDQKVREFKDENRAILEHAMELNKLKKDKSIIELKEKKKMMTPRQRRASLVRAESVVGKTDGVDSQMARNAEAKGRELLDLERELKEVKALATNRSQAIKEGGVAFFLAFTYLIFASTSSVILRVFHCDQFGDDLTKYLVADKNIVCELYHEQVGKVGDFDYSAGYWTKNQEYEMLKMWALLGVGVYPLGIPAMYYYLLYKNRKILKHNDLRVGEAAAIVAPISFLWKMYEPEKWWFEVFECFRRLSLTGLLIFIMPGTASQIVVAMIISLIAIKTYGYFEPFVEDADDVIAEISQYAIFLTLLSALMLKVDETGVDETAMGVMLLFINSLALILAIGAVAYEPLVVLFNLTLKIHVHHGELKELKKGDESDRKKVYLYFQQLCQSDQELAGWEGVRNFSSGIMSRNLEKLVDAQAEWRCSYGYGAYDQMRVKCKLGGNKDGQMVDYEDIKKFIVNREHNKKAKVVKEHTLKHVNDSEQHTYKVFSVSPFMKHRDAVLEVTSTEHHNKDGKRVFTHIGRTLSHHISEGLFPRKTSSRLGRSRATIVFEGYQMTELEDGEVEVVYTSEMNLGGFMTSNFFLRKYYYSMFKFKVEELYDFSVDPDKWFLPFEIEDDTKPKSIFASSFQSFFGGGDSKNDEDEDGDSDRSFEEGFSDEDVDSDEDDEEGKKKEEGTSFFEIKKALGFKKKMVKQRSSMSVAFAEKKIDEKKKKRKEEKKAEKLEKLSEHALLKRAETKDRKEYGKDWGKGKSLNEFDSFMVEDDDDDDVEGLGRQTFDGKFDGGSITATRRALAAKKAEEAQKKKRAEQFGQYQHIIEQQIKQKEKIKEEERQLQEEAEEVRRRLQENLNKGKNLGKGQMMRKKQEIGLLAMNKRVTKGVSFAGKDGSPKQKEKKVSTKNGLLVVGDGGRTNAVGVGRTKAVELTANPIASVKGGTVGTEGGLLKMFKKPEKGEKEVVLPPISPPRVSPKHRQGD